MSKTVNKNKKKQAGVHGIFYYIGFLIPAAAALVLFLLLPYMPGVTEAVFSRGIFPVLMRIISFFNGWLPISLTEYALIFLPAAIIVTVIILIRATRKNKKNGKRLWIGTMKVTGWILSCSCLVYMLMHGANFYRYSLPELTGLQTVNSDAALLEEVTMRLAYEANEARLNITEDEKGVMKLSGKLSDTLSSVNEGYKVLSKSFTFLKEGAKRTKPVLLSYYWSYTGITGMYNPLFAEANVNVSACDHTIPFTAAHETAHTMGFAREDECNFLAFLCCINHPSADFKYSGYLMAFVYCSNELASVSPEAYQRVQGLLSPGIKRDIKASNEYWHQFEGKVEEISSAVNNSFITIQGVSDGTRSYNRVVQLILGYYKG